MSKHAISVTLDEDNLLWLRGRSRAARHRSVSDTLDRLITKARADAGSVGPSRSVKGTIRILGSDPSLARADAVIRALFGIGAATDGTRSVQGAEARRHPRRRRD